MRGLLIVLCGGFLGLSSTASPSSAQRPDRVEGTRPTAIEQRVQALEARIRALEERAGDRVPAVHAEVQGAIALVSAGLQQGTGFLVNSPSGRLVATNHHVVAGGQAISVTLDSLTRVPATLVLADEEADMALLRIPSAACEGCPVLSIAPDSVLGLLPGQTVLAVGYPFGKWSAVSVGVVSNVTPHAIMTDLTLNSGNSGGPLLDLAGRVLGVNSFIVQGAAGPGLSGTVPATRLKRLLQEVDGSNTDGPEMARLPVQRGPPYPISMLATAVESLAFDSSHRDKFALSQGRIAVLVETPLYHFALMNEIEATSPGIG